MIYSILYLFSTTVPLSCRGSPEYILPLKQHNITVSHHYRIIFSKFTWVGGANPWSISWFVYFLSLLCYAAESTLIYVASETAKHYSKSLLYNHIFKVYLGGGANPWSISFFIYFIPLFCWATEAPRIHFASETAKHYNKSSLYSHIFKVHPGWGANMWFFCCTCSSVPLSHIGSPEYILPLRQQNITVSHH